MLKLDGLKFKASRVDRALRGWNTEKRKTEQDSRKKRYQLGNSEKSRVTLYDQVVASPEACHSYRVLFKKKGNRSKDNSEYYKRGGEILIGSRRRSRSQPSEALRDGLLIKLLLEN